MSIPMISLIASLVVSWSISVYLLVRFKRVSAKNTKREESRRRGHELNRKWLAQMVKKGILE